MNRFFLCLFFQISLFFIVGNNVVAQTNALTSVQQESIDTLTDRLIRNYLTEIYKDSDVDNSMRSMQPDGSWSSIDYDAKEGSFKSVKHLSNLRAMSQAYISPESRFYNSGMLLDKILLGFSYFLEKRPISLNWWYNDIGVPQEYAAALILLKGKIETKTLLHYSSYLEDKTDNLAHTGKNRTWVSAITIHKGCLENNFQLIRKGLLSIASTIEIVDVWGKDGIQMDYSFHQHHPQLYSGGYGMSIMNDFATFILLTDKTVFSEAFTPEKRQILSDVFLKGHQMFGYRGTFDYGTTGRNITRPNSIRNMSASVLDMMIINDPGHAGEYEAWKNHIAGGAFPVPGNTHFWTSDIMTHHGRNYYLSAKVLSKRTNGTEMINKENLKGYNLPLGATNILTTGAEYTNIFPVWDWTRIPGTTAALNLDSTHLGGYFYGSNEFGGGVSNGKNGIITFEQDYRNIQAKKSYFFIGDVLLCLGAGISAGHSEPVATSVNQCYLSGDITCHAGSKTEAFSIEKKEFDKLSWVYHNQVGYIFLGKEAVIVQNTLQTGSWHDINMEGSKEDISKRVFSIWIDHGKTPINANYQYLVAPDMSLRAFGSFAKHHGFCVVKNTSDIQAVKNDRMQTYAIVFYNPGTVDLGKGLKICSDQKAIVLINRLPDGYEVSVSDPVCRQSAVNISLNDTTINFIFPIGLYTGKTVTKLIVDK